MNKEQIEKLRIICRDISILYVEDDSSISMQVEKFLKKIFTNISIEKNGLLGLRSFTKNTQDIVITDISMPLMDGIKMAKQIKLLNSEQNILVTSAHTDSEYLVDLIELGVDKFITKPIDMKTFLSSISKIAIGIYRERREKVLEKKLQEEKELQTTILESIAFPLGYFDDDALLYANNAFKEHFFTSIEREDMTKFKLGYLFEEKKYVSYGNAEMFDMVEASEKKIFSIMDVQKKIRKKYNIKIVGLQSQTRRLVSFINLEEINKELDRLKTQVDYFPKRESFENAVLVQKNKSEENYGLFCIGLKNINRFVTKYGGANMHSVYIEFAKKLKKEFAVELQEETLCIYLFETNRYIVLSDANISDLVQKRLEKFGVKNFFEYGSRLPFELNVTAEKIEHSLRAEEVLKNAEGMLYTFDD